MLPDMSVLLREFARRPVAQDPGQESEAPPQPANDAAPTEAPHLIGHILDRYHEVHRREFPVAIGLARRVESVHAAHPRCPRGLADHLLRMIDELEAHQRKEEEVLFPMILGGGTPMIRFPIGRMVSEHAELEEQLDRLAALTGNFTSPAEASEGWRDLNAACRKIHTDLREHFRLEDELFARFEA